MLKNTPTLRLRCQNIRSSGTYGQILEQLGAYRSVGGSVFSNAEDNAEDYGEDAGFGLPTSFLVGIRFTTTVT